MPALLLLVVLLIALGRRRHLQRLTSISLSPFLSHSLPVSFDQAKTVGRVFTRLLYIHTVPPSRFFLLAIPPWHMHLYSLAINGGNTLW